jgi:ABC-type nitrate/sulfonate/bicarbonate transport system substrate-binding protein
VLKYKWEQKMTKFKKRKFKVVILIVIIIVAIGSFYRWDRSQPNRAKQIKKVTFATVPSMVEVTSHIAYHNKYFKEEGLDIDLTFTPSGNLSLEKLLKGEFDIVTVTGTPVVHKSFIRNDFYIVGDIVHPVEHQVLARKDSGINSPSDLKGKRVGVMKGTSADFFMDSFLIFNDLNRSNLEIENILAPELPAAIEKGKVDAIFCWQPFIHKAQQKLGENAIILPSKNIHTVPWLIITMKKYAQKNPEVLKKFVRAIVKAENFLKQNKEESITIHANMSKTDKSVVSALIDNMTYDISLKHYLLVNLENQARWAIRHKYTDQNVVPDYLKYIYTDALEKVKPKSMTIIKGRQNED